MSFDESWGHASVDNDGGEAPEPGIYDVAIDDAKAFTSRAGKDVLIFELRVVTGPAMGHQWTEMRGFDTAPQTKAAKSMCHQLDVPVDEVESLEGLDQQVKGLIGRYFEVDIVQNGQWRNCYVRGPSATTPAGSDLPSQPVAAPAAPVDEEDIPF